MQQLQEHYLDERFTLALRKLRYKTAGPWILALPRPDLDMSSKRIATSHVEYKITAKNNQVAVMHVLAKGPGRVRLGYREQITVEPGDLVLVNLREAGHWITLDGETLYLFTGDVPFARVHRTTKPTDAPPPGPERDAWDDAWFWTIRDVLSDYVLLGRDPEQERLMRNGPETRLHIPGNAQTDGTRSDNERDNRFPIVYRRVLGVGPGKWLTRESDLGLAEREECRSEARPGDMMAMCKSVQAASFMFQGAPFEVIHAASVLTFDAPVGLEVHESVPKPLTWDEPPDEADSAFMDPELAEASE